jgi:hypothetical protein
MARPTSTTWIRRDNLRSTREKAGKPAWMERKQVDKWPAFCRRTGKRLSWHTSNG